MRAPENDAPSPGATPEEPSRPGKRAGKKLVGRVRNARLYLALAVVLGLLGAAATIAQLALLSRAIAGVFLGGEEPAAVLPLLVWFVIATALRAIFSWAKEAVAGWGAVAVKRSVRDELFRHLARLGPAYARGERTGELVAAATEGVERLEGYFARYMPQKVLCVLVPLIIAAFVFPMDPASAMLLLVTGPVIPVMMAVVGSYSEEHINKQWASLSRTSAYFLDVIQGLTTLKVFGRSLAERERVAAVSEEFRRRTMKVLRYAFLSGLVLEFMTATAIGLVAVVLGVRVISGSVPFEAALLILLLAPEFYKPLRELGASRHDGMEGEAAAGRIFEVLETEPQARRASPKAELPGSLDISLSGVRYTYPGGVWPALDGVDLEVPAGCVTALVGPSGAGKSTVISLLMRFAEPDEGEVLAGGVRISDLPADLWRERVALVPQRPYLFHGTLMDNLLLARPGAGAEEVERASRLAGLDELLERLPRGLDTPVGERGLRLSGGEAQRVAIARAFLKDAPVLVLDEPTSNLDPENERIVRDSLGVLMEGRTVLVVAHRLSTVRRADLIHVLEAGRVAESGTHEDLVRRGGLYAELLAGYRGAPA